MAVIILRKGTSLILPLPVIFILWEAGETKLYSNYANRYHFGEIFSASYSEIKNRKRIARLPVA
jgi:hypothetical protein